MGLGPQSAPSNSVRVGAPGTPSAIKALPGKNQATLKWVAPTTTNGKPLTGYVVTPFLTGVPQAIRTFNSLATTQVVTGLLNGRSYTFRVAAKNANGTGLVSPASPAVLVAGAPAPPAGVRAGRGRRGRLRVTFIPGATNGLAITSFTSTCTSRNGGVSGSRSGVASPILVTGLSPNKTYTCNVRATNARGNGPVSTKSPAVTA